MSVRRRGQFFENSGAGKKLTHHIRNPLADKREPVGKVTLEPMPDRPSAMRRGNRCSIPERRCGKRRQRMPFAAATAAKATTAADNTAIKTASIGLGVPGWRIRYRPDRRLFSFTISDLNLI